jgi:NADPH:quinone reductase-like Zn-dependent oxidoreductase
MMALQLAKLAGLRVIAVADLVRHGARLSQLGADLLVDRQDSSRAVEIIRGVTHGQLRFALDAVGKETAEFLQQALRQKDELRSHLVGLTGLPKEAAAGVRHHAVPIKIFHSTVPVGEPIMVWLEQLLEANVLAPPDVDVARGGLGGVNDALDQLKDGKASGKRIVVPLGKDETSQTNGDESDEKAQVKIGSVAYAEKINADPERIKFA